jgi:hypothetical protein
MYNIYIYLLTRLFPVISRISILCVLDNAVVVLAIVESNISEKFKKKIRNHASRHYSLRRNFKRGGHPHHKNAYYSEVGSHFRFGNRRQFLARKTKNHGNNIGKGYMDDELEMNDMLFGKLAKVASDNFNSILNGVYCDFEYTQTEVNSLEILASTTQYSTSTTQYSTSTTQYSTSTTQDDFSLVLSKTS